MNLGSKPIKGEAEPPNVQNSLSNDHFNNRVNRLTNLVTLFIVLIYILKIQSPKKSIKRKHKISTFKGTVSVIQRDCKRNLKGL